MPYSQVIIVPHPTRYPALRLVPIGSFSSSSLIVLARQVNKLGLAGPFTGEQGSARS